jgi:hypothetical protein
MNFFSPTLLYGTLTCENKRQRQITAAEINFVRWAEEYTRKYYRNDHNFVDEVNGRICTGFRRT